jgi:hypothetical protein
LLRTRDKLHSSVIDNHIVESDTLVFILLGDVAASAQEQTITEFPKRREWRTLGICGDAVSTRLKSYMMFALWTAVTFLRLFLTAKSKAKRAIRSVLARVMILRDSTTPG